MGPTKQHSQRQVRSTYIFSDHVSQWAGSYRLRLESLILLSPLEIREEFDTLVPARNSWLPCTEHLLNRLARTRFVQVAASQSRTDLQEAGDRQAQLRSSR